MSDHQPAWLKEPINIDYQVSAFPLISLPPPVAHDPKEWNPPPPPKSEYVRLSSRNAGQFFEAYKALCKSAGLKTMPGLYIVTDKHSRYHSQGGAVYHQKTPEGKKYDIFLPKDFFDLLSAEEVLSVIAHEFGHIPQQERPRTKPEKLYDWLNRNSSLSMDPKAYSNDGKRSLVQNLQHIGMMALKTPASVGVLMVAPFVNQNLEREADDYAVELVGSRPFISMTEKLEKKHTDRFIGKVKPVNLMHAHPEASERIARAQNLAKKDLQILKRSDVEMCVQRYDQNSIVSQGKKDSKSTEVKKSR